MNKLQVVKIGGNILNDESTLAEFIDLFVAMEGHKILVHGGGKEASAIAKSLGVETKMIDGRRITDKEMLRVVTMVYGGLMNKSLVAMLQSKRCNALGLTGADLNLIPAHKRNHPTIDYGYVGDFDISEIKAGRLSELIHSGVTPVFCALTHDQKGSLLNTNADTMAAGVASALSKNFEVSLHLCFEKKGVLEDAEDDDSVISNLTLEKYDTLKSAGNIHSGMIPKLDNGFNALSHGVKQVWVRHALEKSGTALIS